MNRKTRPNWERVLAKFSRSGLTRKKFCEKEGLSYSGFSSFLSRRKKSQNTPAVSGFVEVALPESLAVAPQPDSWVDVEPASPGRDDLVVELPLGVTLRFRGVA